MSQSEPGNFEDRLYTEALQTSNQLVGWIQQGVFVYKEGNLSFQWRRSERGCWLPWVQECSGTSKNKILEELEQARKFATLVCTDAAPLFMASTRKRLLLAKC